MQQAEFNTEKAINELWLQAILENALMGVLILKAIRNSQGEIDDFEYLFANKKAEESVNRTGLKGKHIAKEYPGIKKSVLFKQYKEVTETGVPWEDEVYYNDDGLEFWTSVKAIKYEDGCLVMYSDVTEKKQDNLKVQYQRELLQATFDSSPHYIQVFEAVRDENGKIIDYKWILQNHISIKTSGDVKGKLLLSENPGVLKSGTFDRFVRVTETGIPEQAELDYNYERFNNWFFQSVVKLGDGVAITSTDITEHKKKEQELLRLKDELKNKAVDRYTALFNSIDQGYCAIKVKFDKNNNPVDYKFLEVSPSFEHQTGVQNATGKWMRDIAANQDEFWFKKYGSIVLTQKSERFEYFSTPLKRWWSVYAFPIDEPKLQHIGVLFYDITARKKEEKEKEELLNKFARERAVLNATLDSLPIAVWIADKNGKLIQSNDKAVEIWGEQGQYATGIADYKKYKGWRPETGKQLEADDWAMARVILKGETIIGEELQIERFDGKKLFILSNAGPIRDESGNIIGGVTVVQDITVQKKLELERNTAEEKKAYLLKLSDALQFLDDPKQIQYEAMRVLGEHLGAHRAGYAEDNGDGKTVTVSRNYTNGVRRN
jgi:PAS domain S-box-containing protein